MRPPPAHSAGGRRREAAFALLGFSLLSCAWFLPVLRAPLTHTVSGAAGDLTIFAWFLTWVPWAVLHGHDPFVSQHLLWPGGVSTMWNTGVLLLSVLLAPLTLTLGPVATLNVLFVAAPASSAFTAWLLLRRHVDALPATAGALLYGFGPAMAAQQIGHLQLSIMTLPPLIVMAVEDLLQPQGHATRRTGLRLGVLVAAQLLVGEELLAITALAVALWLAVLAVCAPRAVPPALPRLLAGGAVTLATTLLLAGVPLAYQFLGPLQVHEPIQAAVLNVMRPRDLVEPTSRLWLHRGPGPEHSNISEVGGYLGWPLLALLTLGVALQWRRPAVLAVAGVLGVLEVLALGPYLTQADPTSRRLPWAAVDGLPILENILPIRFALPAALAAAVLLALTLQRLRQRSPALAVAAAVAALLPLLPHGWPVLPAPTRPDCLRGPALDRLAGGEPTLLLRYPVLPALATQLWHAEAHFPFPIAGGYAVHPDPATGLPVLDGDRDAAALAFRQLGAGAPGPLPDAAAVLAALQDMRITRVLVTPGPSAAAERVFLEQQLRLVPVAVADCTLYAVR